MAALQPPVGGLPFSQRSFTDVVQRSDAIPQQQESATLGTHRGLPMIAFSDSHNVALSKPFIWALVGKFTRGYNKKDPKSGRPSVDALQKHFTAMDFHGSFKLGLLDNRHLLIHFQHEVDYIRLYSRKAWFIGGVTMRVFKWSPFFRVDKESTLVPVWISLPRLPIHLFQKDPLFSIASIFGHPLRMDAATAALKRPSVARIQVEIDVLKERPGKIWIQLGSQEGFWQKIDFEHVPSYCCSCWHIGHSKDQCHVQNPDLRQVLGARQPRQTAASKDSTSTKPNNEQFAPPLRDQCIHSMAKAVPGQPHNSAEEALAESPPRMPVIFCGDDSDEEPDSRQLPPVTAAVGTSAGHEVSVNDAIRTVLNDLSVAQNPLLADQTTILLVDQSLAHQMLAAQSSDVPLVTVPAIATTDETSPEVVSLLSNKLESPHMELVVMLPPIVPMGGAASSSIPTADPRDQLHPKSDLYTTPRHVSQQMSQYHGFQPHLDQASLAYPPNMAQSSLHPYAHGDSDENAVDEEDDQEPEYEDDEQDFIDTHYIRDDIYLQQSRRARGSLDVQFRRGRGRPPGSRGRTYFDVVRTINTRSKTVD